MDDKFNNAMNEIDEALIEEAAHAGRAERSGLRLARNIGLSVCGAAAAAAALTFGISHHLASLPEKVDLLPAESTEANGNISDAIAEGVLQELPVERVDVEDVDRARLSAYAPYFIEGGNQCRSFDNDGNVISSGNTVVVMDCGGYWLQYDATDEEGVIDELLDVRGALERAENVLGASLTDVRMGSYDMGSYRYTVTARFNNGKCLHYSLSCDNNDEQWTMKLLSEKSDYLDGFSRGSAFFREEKSGVYDSVRFNDLSGAYICDSNGDIRVVKHTSEGYFGYLPFDNEFVYSIEDSDTGIRRKYCVKGNGDAYAATEDFLSVIGEVEHQDPQNVVLPEWCNLIGDASKTPTPEVGAVERYHLSYSPDYYGLALTFMTDRDGKVFLYDFSWLYPCTMEKVGGEENLYELTVNFYPDGREIPEDGYQAAEPMQVLINGDTWTLGDDYDLFIDEQGKTKKITLYKGTEFTPDGGGMITDGETDNSEQLPDDLADKAYQRVMPKISDAQAENAGQTVYPIEEIIFPAADRFAHITTYYGYDQWRAKYYHGVCFGGENMGGADIYAAQSGTVIVSDFDVEYYGNYVVIDHGNGYATLYAHCSDIIVNEGQAVSQGDVIGHVGATGFATGDCLHFEVRENGSAVDPMIYLVLPSVENNVDAVEQEINDIQAENQAMREAEQQELNERWAELIASVPDPNFLYPAGEDYGVVEHVYGHSPDSGYYGHSGIDIGVGFGEPVLAAADGEVILAQWYYGYGNCVMIQHDNGVVTIYGHCAELYVSKGDTVTRGQTVAVAGATGNATDPHLHFEVRINDEWVDPALFEYQILINGELSERTTFD
ncbi:MAG: M23 family metallopeptidase [Oscillospiraceae bacterium]|nr:M23 family metallopeptidase [Oscillospiraceae bacterium]